MIAFEMSQITSERAIMLVAIRIADIMEADARKSVFLKRVNVRC